MLFTLWISFRSKRYKGTFLEAIYSEAFWQKGWSVNLKCRKISPYLYKKWNAHPLFLNVLQLLKGKDENLTGFLDPGNFGDSVWVPESLSVVWFAGVPLCSLSWALGAAMPGVQIGHPALPSCSGTAGRRNSASDGVTWWLPLFLSFSFLDFLFVCNSELLWKRCGSTLSRKWVGKKWVCWCLEMVMGRNYFLLMI